MVLHPHSHNHGHSNKRKKRRSEESRSERVEGKETETVGENGHGQKQRFWRRRKREHKYGSEENINVRAAFIHVIGDLLQSVGVVIAGYIIWFKVCPWLGKGGHYLPAGR